MGACWFTSVHSVLSVADRGPTLTQFWFKSLCGYCQHAATASMKYWLGLNRYIASTGDSGLTFSRHVHWVSVSLYSLSAVCTARAAAQQTRGIEPVLVWCWASIADGRPASDQNWVNVSCLLGVLTSHIVFRTLPFVKILKLLPNWLSLKRFSYCRYKRGFPHIKIHSLYCPRGAIFNNFNYKSHWHYIYFGSRTTRTQYKLVPNIFTNPYPIPTRTLYQLVPYT